MHILTDPNALESLKLQEPALRELRRQLAIPGHTPEELHALWQALPARLIQFEAEDQTGMLLMALLSRLPPEFDVPIGETLWLRLYLVNDYGAGLYVLQHIPAFDERSTNHLI